MTLSRDDELDLHRRLLDGDPVAPAECVEAYGDAILAQLRRRFPGAHPDMLHDAATQAMFDYVRRPQIYDPDKLALPSFLLMAASGDVRNLLKKEARRLKTVPLDDVEFSLSDGNSEQDDDSIDLPPGVSAREVLDELWRQVPDERDRRVLELMIVDEEKRTEVFARALGIAHLPIGQQRDEVKRAKDRLKQRVRRLREKFRGSEPA